MSCNTNKEKCPMNWIFINLGTPYQDLLELNGKGFSQFAGQAQENKHKSYRAEPTLS